MAYETIYSWHLRHGNSVPCGTMAQDMEGNQLVMNRSRVYCLEATV